MLLVFSFNGKVLFVCSRSMAFVGLLSLLLSIALRDRKGAMEEKRGTEKDLVHVLLSNIICALSARRVWLKQMVRGRGRLGKDKKLIVNTYFAKNENRNRVFGSEYCLQQS